jgi:hypothetical protein
VDGHRAFWAGAGLVWQYARAGWAALTWPASAPGVRTPRHDTVRRQREAIKIAEHLRFGAATAPLVFPAQLTGLTPRWRISDVYYLPNAGVLRAESFMLTTHASRYLPHVGDLGVWTNAPYIQIHPSPRNGTCTPHDPATKNTTLRPGLRPEGVALRAVWLTGCGEPGTFGAWLMTSPSGTAAC